MIMTRRKPTPEPARKWHIVIIDYVSGQTKPYSRRARDYESSLARAERKAATLCSGRRVIVPVSNGFTITTPGQDPRWGVHLAEAD